MAKYFILIEHTDYVAKNKLSSSLQNLFLKLNKTITTDLTQTISQIRSISDTCHFSHPRCKELRFETVTKQQEPGMEGPKNNDAWCGHWGVAIAKFYKIREEAQDV